MSLICSDHPQTYSLPIELFGQSRLPKPGQPGISIFDLQARIGHSSPEIHAFFPRNLTVRQTLENAWADTFLGKAQLNHQRDRDVDAHLRWFHAELNPGASLLTEKDATTAQDPVKSRRAPDLASVPSHRASHQIERIEAVDLDWADELRFGDISFSAQRVALFLRAIIKRPDLVILDEAFSGMDAYVRDRCMLWLDHGQQQIWSYVVEDGTPRKRKRNLLTKVGRMGGARFSGLSQEQALICVSHVKEEVPNSVRQWMCLPDPDTRAAVRCGRLVTPLSGNWKRWDRIWGM